MSDQVVRLEEENRRLNNKVTTLSLRVQGLAKQNEYLKDGIAQAIHIIERLKGIITTRLPDVII